MALIFRLLHLLVVLYTVTRVQCQLATECAKGFSNVGGSCYKMINVFGNQAAARKLCGELGKGVDLATIRCQFENDGVLAMAKRHPDQKESVLKSKTTLRRTYSYDYQAWIGLHDHTPTTAKWYLDDDTGYRHWSGLEPSYLRETCVQFYLSRGIPGKWNDITCAAHQTFGVCEQRITTSGDGCRPKNPEEDEEECEA